MDLFLPDREPDAVLALMKKLQQAGLRGRDAAYLASLRPCPNWDESAQANYLHEFRFMVAPDKRAEVAAVLDLDRY